MGKAWEYLSCERYQVEVRWTLEGRGPHSNNILDFITTPKQDPSHSWDREYSIWPVRNLLPGVFYTKSEVGHCPPPTSTLRPHHMISVSRSSPFFATLLLLCIFYTECGRKNRGGLGRAIQLVSKNSKGVPNWGPPPLYLLQFIFTCITPNSSFIKRYQYRGTIRSDMRRHFIISR